MPRRNLSRQTVQINRACDGGIGIARELAQQTRGHTRKNVAGASGSHGRGAGRIDPDAAIGKSDHGPFTFQNYSDVAFRGEGSRTAPYPKFRRIASPPLEPSPR